MKLDSNGRIPRLAAMCGILIATLGRADAQPDGEAVTFSSGSATLAGILHRATGPGPHPAIVLIGGTGPGRKDGPFIRPLIAPFIAAGYDVFSYDKRGVGDSPGHFDPHQPLEGLAEDGIAAVHALQRTRGIDPKHIGVWGVSQGGWVGPLMATMSHDVAFVITVAAPGDVVSEVEIFQRGQQLLAQGYSPGDVREIAALRRILWSYYGTGYGRPAAEAALLQARERAWFARLEFDAVLGTPDSLDAGLRDFYRQMLYDPARIAEGVSVPVLVIFGAKDSLAPVDDGLARLMRAYFRGGNQRVEFALFPNGGHGLQLVTGPLECHDCAEGEAFVPVPGYFERMAAFLRDLRSPVKRP